MTTQNEKTRQDKTGDQLVASIRKTKSGAAARKTDVPDTSETPAPAVQPAPVVKKSPVKKSTNTNGYSSGRRVWPD